MTAILYSNYAQRLVVDVTTTDLSGNTIPLVIAPGTTVELLLRDTQQQALAPKKTVVESTQDSNWAQGRIVAEFTAADLANIDTAARGDAEFSIDSKPGQTDAIEYRKGVLPGAP